jgi:hypothetical protein
MGRGVVVQRPASIRARAARWQANTLDRLTRILQRNVYATDGLITMHRHAFTDDLLFQRAYQRGVDAVGGSDRYPWQWRMHIGLCAGGLRQQALTAISSSAASVMGS